MEWNIVRDLLGVIGPLAGVALGSWLTTSRARQHHVQDMRRAAYGSILAELALIERRLDGAAEVIGYDLMHYFHSEGYLQDNSFIAEHMGVAHRRFLDDYLILSDEFIRYFEEMKAEMREDPNQAPPEEHEQFDRAVREGRSKLLKIARREMAST